MKVLLVTTSYPRSRSDLSGIFIKRLAMAMVRMGAEVTVLAPGDRDAQTREWRQGIHVVRFIYAPRCLMRIGYGNGGIPENLYRWPLLFGLLPFFLFSMIVHAIILAKECDVIHANWLHTGLFSLPAKKIRKKPLVVTLRGSDLKGGASNVLRFLISKVDALTTVNQTWATFIKNKYRRPVFYTPNGVEVSKKAMDLSQEFCIDSKETIVLYMGVLRKVKGADLLAEIAKTISALDPSVRFLVVGPGNPQEFGLNNLPNVICVGQLSPQLALEVYPSCDIFVLPSRSEGRPNALLEAMASGLPSVVARLPGVVDILTDECGTVVDAEDVHAFANALCSLAQNPDIRKVMGENAKARVAELSLNWESSARRYLRIFERIHSCAE